MLKLLESFIGNPKVDPESHIHLIISSLLTCLCSLNNSLNTDNAAEYLLKAKAGQLLLKIVFGYSFKYPDIVSSVSGSLVKVLRELMMSDQSNGFVIDGILLVLGQMPFVFDMPVIPDQVLDQLIFYDGLKAR